MGLPGVKVGPLDPDRTESFGMVAARNSARTLIRLHAQANPPELVAASARPHDLERTKALNLEEVCDYLGNLKMDDGDPAVPKGAEVVGAAVHGKRDGEQTLVYVFRGPSGRTAKWFAPYSEKALPESFGAGTERVRIAELRERGVMAVEGGAPAVASAPSDAAARNLERENAKLRAELKRAQEQLDAPEVELGAEGNEPDGDDYVAIELDGDDYVASVAAEEPPMEDYDGLKAAEVAQLLKSEDASDELRQAILDYEETHQNRKGVMAAAHEALGTRGRP